MMTKMKRSEFKALVKECVRECLREVMQEQINPVGIPMQEMLVQRQLAPTSQMGVQQVINPMDEYQMRLRQELMQQKSLMQQQLQRQAMLNPMQQQVASLSELAGLGAGAGDDPFDKSSARKYLGGDSGYMSPGDRARLNVGVQSNQQGRFDPTLDSPIAGSMRQHVPQQRVMRLDPELDTPVGGGDMRPPDPNVMKNIFEDTARTTYRAQAEAGHTRPGAASTGGGGESFMPPADRFAEIVSQHRPEELFPGAANWGKLAF